ncbi:hypothetical protein BKA61DRAFT_52153 [Leptodontidium sp. MPI-SDFR-AT-0119]|nr:hypothetical protein BKA61DRAFT_52153 [Leptodontidium sp. MPI-SDFR-AT-0119]
MSNSKKTYFLAPDFHLPPPPNGPLSLGSIITSPSTPERILNKANQTPLSEASIYVSHQRDWSSTRGVLKENTFGVWTSFLQLILGISADVEVHRKHDTSEAYKCRDLETTYFHPDEAYIHASLKHPTVKSYMEKSWWRTPVYLVTGIKIARGMSAESEKVRGHGGALSLGVDATLLTGGVPIQAGPQVETASEKMESVSWSGGEDFIFAYRLVRIKKRLTSGEFTEVDYNKGALYDTDASSNSEQASGQSWSFDEVAGTDDDAEDAPTSICTEPEP